MHEGSQSLHVCGSNIVHVTAGQEGEGAVRGKHGGVAVAALERAGGAVAYTQSMRAVPVPITTWFLLMTWLSDTSLSPGPNTAAGLKAKVRGSKESDTL